MAQLENSFQSIAHIYHRFNNNQIYPAWLEFTLNQSHGQRTKVLDLACGNGEFTRLLAPYCQRIDGLDYDPAMIKAAQSLTGPEATINYYCMDMRQLSELHQQYHLITCYLDAFCFLPDKAAIGQAFHQIYQSLRTDGILLFDVWTLAGLQNFDDFEYVDVDQSAALIWQSELLTSQKVLHRITVFEQVDQGDYRRISVDLKEQTFPISTYLDLLVEAGFRADKIQVFTDLAGNPYQAGANPNPKHDRWFIKVVK